MKLTALAKSTGRENANTDHTNIAVRRLRDHLSVVLSPPRCNRRGSRARVDEVVVGLKKVEAVGLDDLKNRVGMTQTGETNGTDNAFAFQSFHDVSYPAGLQYVVYGENTTSQIPLTSHATMQVQDVQAFAVQPLLAALDGTDDCTLQVIQVARGKVDLGTDDR